MRRTVTRRKSSLVLRSPDLKTIAPLLTSFAGNVLSFGLCTGGRNGACLHTMLPCSSLPVPRFPFDPQLHCLRSFFKGMRWLFRFPPSASTNRGIISKEGHSSITEFHPPDIKIQELEIGCMQKLRIIQQPWKYFTATGGGQAVQRHCYCKHAIRPIAGVGLFVCRHVHL